MSTVINQRYELIRILGQGGYGAVYEARDLVLNRKVALKQLHGDSFGPQIKERFLDEARITSSLSHPSALTMYDFGITERGDPYLVTELLQGLELQDYLKRRRLSEAETVGLLEQVGGALVEAHAQGIIHRDIKPANLYVHAPAGATDGAPLIVKLLDFGIAKVLSKPAGTGTRSGAIIGTPAYMAPEQIRDSSKVDARCDQYSLGLVAFECLNGAPAFSGRDEFEVMSKQINHPLPDLAPSELPSEGLGPLFSLIQRMCAKEPEGRFADLPALLASLTELQQLHPEGLKGSALDPEPLKERLESLKGQSFSKVSAPSFGQLSSSQSLNSRSLRARATGAGSSEGAHDLTGPKRSELDSLSETLLPSHEPSRADSLSETLTPDDELGAEVQRLDSLSETLIPEDTPATLIAEERSPALAPTESQRQTPAQLDSPQEAASTSSAQNERGAPLSSRLSFALASAAILIVALWVGLGAQNDEMTAPLAQREAPLQLGPQRKVASQFKVVMSERMPPQGYQLGQELELMVQNRLGHQILDFELQQLPACLKPIEREGRALVKVVDQPCGDVIVQVGQLRAMMTVAINRSTDELLEELDL